jgi:hypothetical protein
MVPPDQTPASRPPPATYRLEISGPLPAGFADSLEGFTVATGPATTSLTGQVVDAAALYGLIARVEALGLSLLSVGPTEQP